MTRLRFEISMSLDGFVAGPDATLEDPLGQGGERLHDWVVGLASFRERHGTEGGEDSADSRTMADRLARTGATIMGRRMYSGGAGPWAEDPNADGWWGDDPPFRTPVFVLTHHPRETVEKRGGGGVRLFEGFGPGDVELRPTDAIVSPGVTHLTYDVVR
jgi:dihydrofolate reductase